MRYGFGVDLGGTTVKLAFFREDGVMLHKWEIPTVTENAGAQILPDIARSVECFMQENGYRKEQILGIGIGVPGPVDRYGVVHICDNLGWGVVDVKSHLQKLTGFLVQVGNDANVAALGESWVGGGKGCDNMVLATFGTGVGGGIMAVVPNSMGIGIYSPALDNKGNSVAGIKALEKLSHELGLSIF